MQGVPKLPLEYETRVVRVPDGTEIAYHVTEGDGPAIVLANGLGGTLRAWRSQVDYLGDRYRFVTWDYRGLYGSSKAAGGDYSVAAHAQDLASVLVAERIERAAMIGWSMGVQVLLEAYGRDPSPFAALVLINGAPGRPLDTASALPGARRVLPPLVAVAHRLHGLAGTMTRRARESPETIAWLRRAGLIGETLEEATFTELVAEFAGLDMERFFKNLAAIGRHDAEHVLARIEVPTLIIAGERDPMTPRSLAERMARRIARSELLLVRGGTHYATVEFPELINLRLERFLRACGLEAEPSRCGAGG